MASLAEEAISSVPPAEMAFAMTLFVGAATLRSPDNLRLSPHSAARCKAVLASIECGDDLPDAGPRNRGESTLEEAFLSLWVQYEGSEHQTAVCTRVLAFHFLMTRTRGAALAGWTFSCAEAEEAVTLHPAVVETLATVPLQRCASLGEPVFRSWVEYIALLYAD